jgi:hypothetical protein
MEVLIRSFARAGGIEVPGDVRIFEPARPAISPSLRLAERLGALVHRLQPARVRFAAARTVFGRNAVAAP